MMLVLVEPCINGVSADKVIGYLRFDRSQQVEAFTFTGGIWVTWNKGIHISIIYNHS